MSEKITAADAIRLLDAHEAAAVDVREPDEFAVGHIPGAKLLPLGQVLSRAAEVLPDKNDLRLFYCRPGRRNNYQRPAQRPKAFPSPALSAKTHFCPAPHTELFPSGTSSRLCLLSRHSLTFDRHIFSPGQHKKAFLPAVLFSVMFHYPTSSLFCLRSPFLPPLHQRPKNQYLCRRFSLPASPSPAPGKPEPLPMPPECRKPLPPAPPHQNS